MKKLTKMSLEKLAKTMSVISENEMDMYWGMYNGDCFWRCIAWLSSGGTDRSEETAATYALEYTAENHFGGCTVSADYHLTTYSAGMDFQEARSYVQGDSALEGRIKYFKTSDFSEFGDGTDVWHAVVSVPRDSSTPDDSNRYYDPQNDKYVIISNDKLKPGDNYLSVR